MVSSKIFTKSGFFTILKVTKSGFDCMYFFSLGQNFLAETKNILFGKNDFVWAEGRGIRANINFQSVRNTLYVCSKWFIICSLISFILHRKHRDQVNLYALVFRFIQHPRQIRFKKQKVTPRWVSLGSLNCRELKFRFKCVISATVLSWLIFQNQSIPILLQTEDLALHCISLELENTWKWDTIKRRVN